MSKLALSIEQRPSLDLRPRLMMSAHMQQAIKLLQLPLAELDNYLEEQVVENPILELSEEDLGENAGEVSSSEEPVEHEVHISENDFTILKELSEDWNDHFSQGDFHSTRLSQQQEKLRAFLDSSIPEEVSLAEHLKREAQETFNDSADKTLANLLIGYIDEWGFLKTPLEEIAALHKTSSTKLQEILAVIQTFEPHGVGAASIQETLLIQLSCQNKKETLAYRIVADHYEDLLHHRIAAIQKSTKYPPKQIQEAIDKDIANLDLHPGTHYSMAKPAYIIPDASILLDEGQLRVDINREHSNILRLNHRYLKLLENPEIPIETKNFIRKHILSAKWLMRNLQQRYSTIERIAHILVIKQRDFFLESTGQLQPLTMKSIAEDLNVHESTIARTVAYKYINTPRGLLPLRSFFTTAFESEKGEILSTTTIKEALKEIVDKENKGQPLSDMQIAALLEERGIKCARRTIAKYRAELHIGSALQRKKY